MKPDSRSEDLYPWKVLLNILMPNELKKKNKKRLYTMKFSLMEPSVPLIKILKVLLYQEFQYIESKFIIVYNNLFQIKIPLYQGFTYVPLYRGSIKLNFTVYKE